MKTQKKIFDCVAMKRSIQERLYEETGSMNHEERMTHVRDRIATSRFHAFLEFQAPARISRRKDGR